MRPSGDRHLVLWDGDCGFCRRSVEWVERHDPGRLECLPYQQAPSTIVPDELRHELAETVHVITTDGSVLRGGRAWLFIMGEIGWRATAAILGVPPFVWIVELGYRLVARNRTRLSRWLFF
ncbi:MAG: DUF393 domain-containing protein [Acidobacteriota bacterium]|nr:DUF393 domain-containing protein [Acidobacteriota bacterium]